MQKQSLFCASDGSKAHRTLRGSRRHRGATIVEFALIIPILLTLLLGIMEWAWLTRTQLTISNAVREGVRFASVGNTATAVRTRVRNAAATLNPAPTDGQIVLTQTPYRNSATPTYYAWQADTATTPARNGVPAGNLMRITVNYPHRSLTNFFPWIRNRTVTVSATMVREAVG